MGPGPCFCASAFSLFHMQRKTRHASCAKQQQANPGPQRASIPRFGRSGGNGGAQRGSGRGGRDRRRSGGGRGCRCGLYCLPHSIVHPILRLLTSGQKTRFVGDIRCTPIIVRCGPASKSVIDFSIRPTRHGGQCVFSLRLDRECLAGRPAANLHAVETGDLP